MIRRILAFFRAFVFVPLVPMFVLVMAGCTPDEELGSAGSEDDVFCVAEAIDLGLSVKWASCNVGASLPSDYGFYYAWGETTPKSGAYKYYDSRKKKYEYIGSNISGTKYDVARVRWGGTWRMPTLDEINELCNKCSWQWTEVNGVNGQKVTGPNGNSIFLPAAGYIDGEDVYYRGWQGDYWSATWHSDGAACDLLFDDDDGGDDFCDGRALGFSVRPVTE